MAESDDPIFLTAIVRFAQLVVQIGGLIVVGGVGILGYQGILWLKDGYWTAMPIGHFLPQSSDIDWSGARGAERIWNALLDFPSSVSVIALGVVVVGLGSWATEQAFTRQEAARRKSSGEPEQ